MRILLDEMLAPAIANQLRHHSFDAHAVTERPELVGAPDTTILEAAATEGRVLVTENIRDFVSLHSLWTANQRMHSGILLVSTRAFPYSSGRVGRLVRAIQDRAATPLDAGTIAFL
ncbi:MAG: DUF5615 family PIN-like protein [Candidatus Nanopelagicales bacterium]|nr:DUF5615 family PIN-like protein [Candidatus Nanopelagicales bacterium]MCF8557385.1 DUF5615 family PIN-like protein [Candidatus Nanopelagicales bacterium]